MSWVKGKPNRATFHKLPCCSYCAIVEINKVLVFFPKVSEANIDLFEEDTYSVEDFKKTINEFFSNALQVQTECYYCDDYEKCRRFMMMLADDYKHHRYYLKE